MPAIKPISELRNYNTVLREVTADTPVFLTKNGHGRFAIVDIRAYEKLRTELDLMSALAEGEESARKGGWVSMDSAKKIPRVLPLARGCAAYAEALPGAFVNRPAELSHDEQQYPLSDADH